MIITICKPSTLDNIYQQHCVIESSAGTGKTYLLEFLVIDFILKRIPLNKIILVTFTNKAVLELQERIRTRLEKIIQQIINSKSDKLQSHKSYWELNEEKQFLIIQAAANLNQMTITTIHGFCQQILQNATLEGRNLLKQQITFNNTVFDKAFNHLKHTQYILNSKLRSIFIKAIQLLGNTNNIRSLLKNAMHQRHYLNLPNKNNIQKQIYSFPIIAAINFINAFNNNISSNRHCYDSMTIKISKISHKAISIRIKKILTSILETNIKKLPYIVWSQIDDLDLIYLSTKLQYINGNNKIIKIIRACNRLKKQYYDFRAIIVATLLPPLIKKIKKIKFEEGLLDFDDMILSTYEIIISKQGQDLINKMQERFTIALIDEFQDTDIIQWKIFSKIFIANDRTNKHQIILVGDPKQAIYGFRNGDLQTYLAATNTIQQITKQKKKELLVNFRCSRSLLDIQEYLFRNYNETPFFTGKNIGLFRPVISGNSSIELQNKNSEQYIPPLCILDVEYNKDYTKMKQYLAKKIALTIKYAIKHYKLNNDNITPNDIMVLTTNSKEGIEIATALNELDINHTFFKQNGLFKTIEAKYILDLMFAIDDPYNIKKLTKVLLGPFFNINLNNLHHYNQPSNQYPYIQQLLDWQQLIISGNYEQFFINLMSNSKILRAIPISNKRSLTNIEHILDIIKYEVTMNRYTVKLLIKKIQCWIDDNDWPNIENCDIQRLTNVKNGVQILTIHKAKGLEAPIVVLYGGLANNKIYSFLHRYYNNKNTRQIWIGPTKTIPAPMQNWIEQEKNEELERLFYVAITRAKAQLILPRIIYGKREYNDHNSSIYTIINNKLLYLSNDIDGNFTTVIKNNDTSYLKMHKNKIIYRNIENTMQTYCNVHTKSNSMLSHTNFNTLNSSITSLTTYQKSNDTITNHKKSYNLIKTNIQLTKNIALEAEIYTLLQELPINSFFKRSFNDWITTPIVKHLLTNKCYVDKTIAKLIYKAMTTPILIPNEGYIIISNPNNNIIRPMNTLFNSSKYQSINKNSIDIFLNFNNKIYALSWKTMLLDSYQQSNLKYIIKKKFFQQTKIYIRATYSLINLNSHTAFYAKFGGLIYYFIYGLNNNNEGIYFLKPLPHNIKNMMI